MPELSCTNAAYDSVRKPLRIVETRRVVNVGRPNSRSHSGFPVNAPGERQRPRDCTSRNASCRMNRASNPGLDEMIAARPGERVGDLMCWSCRSAGCCIHARAARTRSR